MTIATRPGTLLEAVRPAPTSRPVAYGTAGMVCSVVPQAAVAGLQVLRAGGNAFDAAVAAALVEGVMIPASCGIGGDCFVVAHDARSGRVWGLNGSGIVPRAASRAWFLEHGHDLMPFDGVHAIGLPGAVDAYATLLERFGTRPFDALAAPAIDLAERGFAVEPDFRHYIAATAARLRRSPGSTRDFFPGGEPPTVGRVFRRPALAATLRHLAERGPRSFYQGRLAERIVAGLRAEGSLFTIEEWAEHRSEVYEPLATTYRGYTVHQTAPPSQGLIVLEMLNLIEPDDFAALPTAEAVHLMVEAKKLAFADRLAYVGDPRVGDDPARAMSVATVGRLISKGFAARRRAAIDRDRAADVVPGALPESLAGDTSYLCVADAAGNAVSLIHSLSSAFGSGVTAGDTGVVLNNRAGRGFSLEAGHPNVFAGGKRTMHTLNAYLLTRDGRPALVGGTPGGDAQPAWNAQTIVGWADLGLDPQEAVEMARWMSFPGTDPDTIRQPFELRLEAAFPAAVADALRAKGHRVVHAPGRLGGYVQLVEIDRDRGVLRGGTDPRGGGVALGW